MLMSGFSLVVGDEAVTLHEDEFLAGFKPLSEANKPMSNISSVELKVWLISCLVYF